MTKHEHQRIGFISADGSEITRYAHERHRIGECPWCDFMRAEQIAREFIRRMETIHERFEHLYMWSLGTSLKGTPSNEKLLLKWWNTFTTRIRQSEHEWSGLFRVVEVGRRGFLHIHFVCYGYLPHQVVLETWRSLTGEASNVHVSGQKGCQDVGRLIRYLTKYLTKSTSSYRWLGRFCGLGVERGRSVRSSSPPDDAYGGVCYGGYFTETYKWNDDEVEESTQECLLEEVKQNGIRKKGLRISSRKAED